MKAVLNTYYNEPLSVERRIRKPVSHRKQQKDYDHKDKAMGRGIVINDEERHNVRIGIEIIPKDIQNEIIQRCITNDHHENSKETELNQNPEYGHTDPYDDLYYHYSMCRNVSKLWRILSDRCYDQVQHMSRYHKKHMDWIALQACYARRIVFARIILDTKKQSRSTKLLSNYALPHACHNGYEDVVTLLMRYTEVDPTFEDYSALILASEKGSDGIIKILMDRCKACIGLREAVCKMLLKACYFGHLNVITTLLDYPDVQKTFYEGSNQIFTKKQNKKKISKEAIVPHYVSTKMLDKACENSHKDVIIYLLNHPKIVFYDYFPVCSYRYSEEDMEIIELFLDRRHKDGDMRINPSAMNNRAIHVACDKNQPMILARLLKEPDVDPGYENNLALRFSCIEGRIQLIKVLLSDHRVDPTVLNNKELLWIFRMRPSKELVTLLLSIPEVDPGANENMILRYMIRDRPSWELIELLIQHPKVDPSVNDNELFRLAAQSEGERPEILETLLQHPKIDPSANDNEALKSYILANYDNSAGLRILLNDPRVDPCSEEYRPLMNACKVRNYSNLELLLFDHRVIRSVVDSCQRNRPRSQPSKISVDGTGSSSNHPDVTITNFSTLFSTPFQPCDPLSEYAVELFKYARKRDHKGVQSRKDNDDDQEYQRSILSPIQHKTRLADLLTRNGLSMSGCFPDLEELLIRITDVFIGYSINKDTIPVIFADILKRFHNLITTSILAGIDAPK